MSLANPESGVNFFSFFSCGESFFLYLCLRTRSLYEPGVFGEGGAFILR